MNIDLATKDDIKELLEVSRRILDELTKLKPAEDPLLSTKDAAIFMKVKPPTIKDWEKKGRIFNYGMPGSSRYKKSELLRQRKHPGAGRVSG